MATVPLQLHPAWSSNAMAAVPTPATLDDELIDSSAGSVRFRDGKIGRANLICPVPASLHSIFFRALGITYRDPDAGSGLDEQDRPDRTGVSAALRAIPMTGDVRTIATVSSNELNAPGGNGDESWHTHESSAIRRLDFRPQYYYVQITLWRSTGATNIGVMGVYLLPDREIT